MSRAVPPPGLAPPSAPGLGAGPAALLAADHLEASRLTSHRHRPGRSNERLHTPPRLSREPPRPPREPQSP